MNMRASIGLEIHVQLRTRSKIWCACPNRYGQPANTDVCPVCLGYPGVLPVLNREAVRLTVRTGLLLDCRINRVSKFDRKSYFYPDMPKNYQISQYDRPFCEDGFLAIENAGATRRIRIKRIHLEEDVGKSIHQERSSWVDFNRAGTPLMEIVTEPDLASADEAFAFLQALKRILQYGEISDCNLEQGNIRCDVNCSVRPEGQEELGTKTEIKNMNSFHGVQRALQYEIRRQIGVLGKGGAIEQETRRWDDELGATTAMRQKEYAHDYRYFPDPDLLPVVLTDEQIEEWKALLPERPAQRCERLMTQYGLPEYDAGVLAADKAVADYFEAAAKEVAHPKAVSNWIMTEMMRALSENEIEITAVKLSPESLAALVRLVDERVINQTTAKEVFNALFENGGDPRALVEERGLAQVSDTGAIDGLVDEVIAEQPKSVADYRAGKKNAIQFLMGQVMRKSQGKADPQAVIKALKARLG